MSESKSIFSESWHRVAGQRLRLRPSVSLRRQSYRGEPWFVARDGFTNAFFRFRPEAYDFIARLDGTRTVEEVWLGCLERNPESTPSQGDVVGMLAQLYQANLLAADTAADTKRLFERHQKRSRQELASQVFGIFFLRIRLFDPDRFLDRTWPWLRWLGSPVGIGLWLITLTLGLAMVFSNWDRALDQSQAALAPGNLLLLFAAFSIAKLIHEFGHAYAVKAFGGEVHAMGITLLVFTPVPYVDATAAWDFRERWKRVLVGFAGMLPELAYAGIAAVVWAHTGPGTLNSIAYNTMLVASVSTLIFNLNPLLRFDGYYILADLTESPNLQARSMRQWLYLFEKRALGLDKLDSPARTRTEGFWLASFGIASWCYRILITVTIILLVADRYFGLGLLAGVLTFIGAFVLPMAKAVRYFAREPRIERVRRRAWGFAAGALATVVILLGVVPFPNHFRASGIARAVGSQDVHNQVAGWVVDVPHTSGQLVTAGAPLLRLESPELDLAIAAARGELEEVRGRERQMLSDFAAGIEPLRQRRLVAEQRLRQLEEDRRKLLITASAGGQWVAPTSDDWRGLWLARGMRIGEIVGQGPGWEFYAVVEQDNASALFGAAKEGAEIRFPGVAGKVLAVSEWRVVPGKQEILPSSALGWAGQGPIRVRADDTYGVHAAEPFFLVIGRIVPDGQKGADALQQGRVGVMRFALPWSPLAVQWARSFRQLLQQRFQI
jgi:putative peptide zinc metalloprotease protein